MQASSSPSPGDLAVVGMACRFPGAPNVDRFWENLRAGRESIRTYTDEELLAAGADPDWLADPRYVRAKPVIEGVEQFDAGYFGYAPREAELTDPQHRVFLEIALEALERAALDPDDFGGPIGVFAGTGISTYLLRNILANSQARREAGGAAASTGNLPDCLSTRVAYKLNLRGPAYAIQSACSTSLVAVHAACQGLLNFECDAALAGGVAISVPQVSGYLHEEDGVTSPDGHCRAFDARAAGTLFGNGAGVVVIMRLADAQKGGYPIAAVILGTAVNNDGALKAGFTAPSVSGQAEVIGEALANAGIGSADAISYVEAHGTATALGDPIEVAALTRAFRETTKEAGFCALGSVKTNVGHLDTAGGVAGLIKTILALQHREIPPSLHFTSPNPKIDFTAGPFFVNAALRPWAPRRGRRLAGVSAFGVGGTNAHVIVGGPPDPAPSGPSRATQLLVLSARTATALEAVTAGLADALEARPDIALADIAHTLQRGRRAGEHRRAVVAQSSTEALAALRSLDPARVFSSAQKPAARRVAFLFPGQGAQYAGMGRGLYEGEGRFRSDMDRCCDRLLDLLKFDLRTVLFPSDGDKAAAEERLRQSDAGQPALFAIEYSLARLWMSWGVMPQSMIGHSLGEYVAACLAGVFSLEDALTVVAARGRLARELPPGEMLAVPLPAAEVRPLLRSDAALALINTDRSCVVAGTAAALGALEADLRARHIPAQRLETSHAFHSPMIEGMLPGFARVVRGVALNAPAIPFVSNVTGRTITAEQARDPDYWVRQTRQTVYFADGIAELLRDPERAFLEVGPGMTLSNLTRQNIGPGGRQVVVNSMPDPRQRKPEPAAVLTALGRLWLAGVAVDWKGFSQAESRSRVVLPTYPFERRRFWIDPETPEDPGRDAAALARRRKPPGRWLYVPLWRQAPAVSAPQPGGRDERGRSTWLVLTDDTRFPPALAVEAEKNGVEIIWLRSGTAGAGFHVRPDCAEDYAEVLARLRREGRMPAAIVDAWSLGANDDGALQGVHRLMALVRALALQAGDPKVRICVVTRGAMLVRGDERLSPENCAATGLTAVIGQELPNLSTGILDIEWPPEDDREERSTGRLVVRELLERESTPIVALRGGLRWTRFFEEVAIPPGPPVSRRLKPRGVYLITGGLGALGLAIADSLAGCVQARLVLVSRSGLPPRERWPALMADPAAAPGWRRAVTAVMRLEEKGSEVLVVAGNVACAPDAGTIVEAANKAFGRIDGVIHAAGVAGGGLLPLRTRELADAVLAPKVSGILALERALDGIPLDFIALFSSLAAVCGGVGQGDYCAANAFLDGFAWSRRMVDGTRVVSINWDVWREAGMAVDGSVPAGLRASRAEGLRLGLTAAEGVAAFHQALDLDSPQVAVSTVDLMGRIEASLAPGKPAAEPAPARRHPRPALSAEYVEPAAGLERELADLWQSVLGFETIGALDNFFDLGGDSLSAMNVAAAVRKRRQCEFPVTVLFECPTPRLLARRLAATSG